MKLYIGDITKVKADVIVNAADSDFTPSGGVSHWIDKEGGKEIFKEAIKYTPGKVGVTYPTTAGSLNAKAVFHIPTVDWKKGYKITIPEIHDTVVGAMEKLREMKLKSIVFPLLGGGTLKLDSRQVVEEMSDAIIHTKEDFHELDGAICVFTKQVYDDIKDVLPTETEVIEL